ncbi:MAG: putative LPS assembly protein LptD, partial [Bacteroidota bacterium]
MLFLTFYPQESYAQVRPGSTSTPGSIPLPGSGSGLPGSGQGQFPGGLPGQNTNTGSGNLPQEGDQAAVTDTTPKYPPAQQRVVDSLKALSDLQGPVSYGAQDSIVYDVKKGVLYLYDNSSLDYDNLKLQAIRVDINMDDQMLKAFGQEDSSGVIQGKPVFTQDGQSYQAKEVSYNFATQKGRIIEGRLQEGEGFILAEVAKYHPDGSFHGKDGKYTTCDLDHPHFYIKSQKLKMLPDNQLISGPLNLVIADFPIPLFIPFGFIPNNSKKPGQKRKNGLILPQYGEADDRGFFLRNLGYYWGISDFLDLKLDGDIYTRGGWRAAGTLNYNLKYRFQGSFRYQYGVQRFNDPLDPDFSRTTAWQVNWSHNQPIDPTARISASVNMSSSNSFQRNISNNQTDFFTNNLNSSVTFSKNFNNLPFSLSGSMRHQQDLNKETMTMQLPEVALNMKRQTPFKNIRNSNLKFLKQWGIN